MTSIEDEEFCWDIAHRVHRMHAKEKISRDSKKPWRTGHLQQVLHAPQGIVVSGSPLPSVGDQTTFCRPCSQPSRLALSRSIREEMQDYRGFQNVSLVSSAEASSQRSCLNTWNGTCENVPLMENNRQRQALTSFDSRAGRFTYGHLPVEGCHVDAGKAGAECSPVNFHVHSPELQLPQPSSPGTCPGACKQGHEVRYSLACHRQGQSSEANLHAGEACCWPGVASSQKLSARPPRWPGKGTLSFAEKKPTLSPSSSSRGEGSTNYIVAGAEAGLISVVPEAGPPGHYAGMPPWEHLNPNQRFPSIRCPLGAPAAPTAGTSPPMSPQPDLLVLGEALPAPGSLNAEGKDSGCGPGVANAGLSAQSPPGRHQVPRDVIASAVHEGEEFQSPVFTRDTISAVRASPVHSGWSPFDTDDDSPPMVLRGTIATPEGWGCSGPDDNICLSQNDFATYHGPVSLPRAMMEQSPLADIGLDSLPSQMGNWAELDTNDSRQGRARGTGPDSYTVVTPCNPLTSLHPPASSPWANNVPLVRHDVSSVPDHTDWRRLGHLESKTSDATGGVLNQSWCSGKVSHGNNDDNGKLLSEVDLSVGVSARCALDVSYLCMALDLDDVSQGVRAETEPGIVSGLEDEPDGHGLCFRKSHINQEEERPNSIGASRIHDRGKEDVHRRDCGRELGLEDEELLSDKLASIGEAPDGDGALDSWISHFAHENIEPFRLAMLLLAKAACQDDTSDFPTRDEEVVESTKMQTAGVQSKLHTPSVTRPYMSCRSKP